MSTIAELLSKTKYSSIDDLLFVAERIDPDNFILKISINDFYNTPSFNHHYTSFFYQLIYNFIH